MEERKWYIFTFGVGHVHAGMYVRIYGSYSEARDTMFSLFGDKWAFQYTEENWQEWEATRPPWVPAETLLMEIGGEDE